MAKMRLDKLLANKAYGSRKEVHEKALLPLMDKSLQRKILR